MKTLSAKLFKSSVLALSILVCSASVPAAVVDWAGNYRFEYVEVDRTSLGDPKDRKLYALNRLSLSPKIVAVDGFNIISQFEVLSNSQYSGSQLGMPLGQGVNSSAPGAGAESNLSGRSQPQSSLQVRQLYLKINQEYGSIVVGRAPIHFGLGMTYNSGAGAFDHWGDVHDLVGYRFLIDNVSIMPMVGKPYQAGLAAGQSATDVMWNIEYNNTETKSALGVLHQTRTANLDINDGKNIFNSSTNDTYATTNTYANWTTQMTSVYLFRGFDGFNFRMEGGFSSGSTGVFANVSGVDQEIKMNGYGLAIEMDFPRVESKWNWSWKMGLASGDDPLTANFEGFTFNRNYDLGFLLFNHPMGRHDFFGTNIQRNRDPSTGAPFGLYGNGDAADEEAVSNVMYLAPQVDYKASDRWTWRNRLVWAQLQKNPWHTAGNSVAKDVGIEWDTAFIYQPHERIQWHNELGIFNPGGAFKGGSANFETQLTYGFTSKASISF